MSTLSIHICAWCKHIIGIHGDRLVLVSDEDYPKYENHGICLICKAKALESIKKPE